MSAPLYPSRAEAYAASEKSSRAYLAALRRREDVPVSELATLKQQADADYADYRAWANAETEAAIAGAFEHLECRPEYCNEDY